MQNWLKENLAEVWVEEVWRGALWAVTLLLPSLLLLVAVVTADLLASLLKHTEHALNIFSACLACVGNFLAHAKHA
jgi:hypothetical protein